jgi:hypothetical protein
MSQKAHVSSLDALQAFRSDLIVYLNQARPALDEISAEVLRTRMWLENDQRVYWENQLRHRTRDLEQAQQTLFSARLGVLRKESAAEQLAVRKAKESVEAAMQKLRTVKKWDRDFESRVQPLVKQMEKLHTVFSNDMVQALASLTQTINILAAYAEIAPASESISSPQLASAKAPVSSTEATTGEHHGDLS